MALFKGWFINYINLIPFILSLTYGLQYLHYSIAEYSQGQDVLVNKR